MPGDRAALKAQFEQVERAAGKVASALGDLELRIDNGSVTNKTFNAELAKALAQ